MQHDLHVAGDAFALRPVELSDSDFIVELRNNPRLGRFIHPGASDARSQHAWLRSYFEREGDYYFMVVDTRSGALEGTVAIYDVDESNRAAEWGRWVLRSGSLAAIESALLTYRLGFEQLNLDTIYCRTVAANEAVVSFHDSAGLPRSGFLPAHAKLGHETFDLIEHRATRHNWPQIESTLAPLARMLARRRVSQ